MAPRGLSAEEKRVKLLEIFHETKDFYQLKELEKLGPKMKGIVSQSVKDVLQSLVDDGLVQGDKIGSSNFFWSFPSQSGALAQSRLQTVKEARVGYLQQLTDLKTAIELERTARPASELRSQSIEKLSALRQNLISLQTELDAYGNSDPRKVEEAKRAAFLAKEAALRWTDNYGILLGYFTRQSGIEVAGIRKFLDIEEDYEDIY